MSSPLPKDARIACVPDSRFGLGQICTYYEPGLLYEIHSKIGLSGRLERSCKIGNREGVCENGKCSVLSLPCSYKVGFP